MSEMKKSPLYDDVVGNIGFLSNPNITMAIIKAVVPECKWDAVEISKNRNISKAELIEHGLYNAVGYDKRETNDGETKTYKISPLYRADRAKIKSLSDVSADFCHNPNYASFLLDTFASQFNEPAYVAHKQCLAMNSAITMEWVRRYKTIKWPRLPMILGNCNITVEIIASNLDFFDIFALSNSPHLTWKYIANNPNMPWFVGPICRNEMKTYREMLLNGYANVIIKRVLETLPTTDAHYVVNALKKKIQSQASDVARLKS